MERSSVMSEEFAKEIESFLGDEPSGGDTDGEKVVEETVVEDTKATEDKTEEEVVEPTVKVEETTIVQDKVDKTKVEPEVKNDEVVVEESVESLRARIDELHGKLTEAQKGPDLTKAKAEETKVEETKIEDVIKTYLGDVHIDDVVTKPELFVKVLKGVEERAREEAVTRVITQIPNIVIRYIQQHNALQKATTEFYESNSDLAQARKTVGAFANEVSSEHPDWTLEKVLDETAIRARKALGIVKQVQSKSKVKPGDTGLVKGPGKTGVKGKVGNLSGLQKEISDLIS